MKETVIGIVTFLVFYYFNFIILAGISSVLVPGGDAFIKSYVDPVYSGIAALADIVIVCTCMIMKKLDEVLRELKKEKDEESENV